MAHGFINEVEIAAKDIDSLNRTAISKYVYSGAITGDDIDGGYVFNLSKVKLSDAVDIAHDGAIDGKTNSEVWKVVKPATGSLTGLYMAYNPEVKVAKIGNKEYTGLSLDVRDFTNVAQRPFDCFKLCKGDIIALSVDAVENYTSGTSTLLKAVNGSYKLNGGTSASSQTTLTVLEEREVMFPKAGVGNDYVKMIIAQVTEE